MHTHFQVFFVYSITQMQKKIGTLMCSYVGTEKHKHELEACTVYGIFGSMFKNEKFY